MAVAGNTIRFLRRILDLSDVPLGGMVMPTDITAAMFRDTGTAITTAGETVTMTPVAGSAGDYYVEFTPVNTGLYQVILREISVLTALRQTQHDFQVLSAGSIFTPSYANAFCAETDIERWVSTDISVSSDPSDSEAAGFAQSRAAILMSLCAGWGYSVTPSTVPAGSRIKDILREANAIGAALDYTLSQQFRLSPSLSDRPALLQAMWEQYVGRAGAPGSPVGFIPGYLQVEIKMNLASLGTDHIISGDTQAAEPTYPTDIGPGPTTMGTVY